MSREMKANEVMELVKVVVNRVTEVFDDSRILRIEVEFNYGSVDVDVVLGKLVIGFEIENGEVGVRWIRKREKYNWLKKLEHILPDEVEVAAYDYVSNEVGEIVLRFKGGRVSLNEGIKVAKLISDIVIGG